MSHTPSSSSSFCGVCNVQCGNPTRYAQHISGRRHQQAAATALSAAAVAPAGAAPGGDVLQPPEPQVIQEEEEDSQTSREADAASPPPLTDSTAAAVVRTLSPLLAPARLRSLQQAAVQRCRGVHLAFENVVQNDNVASALRTAECAGIHHVHLIRGPQALASKRGGSLKRVDNALSKGAERWLQLHYHYDVAGFLQAVRGAGLKLFGADVDASASTIADCDFGQTAESAGVSKGCGCGCAVIFGNERDGMSSELRAACDDLFFLPSVGLTQSYNVFVSAAMTVHHLQMRSVITPDCDGAQQQVPPNSLSYIPPPESDSEHSCFATYHVVSNYLLCCAITHTRWASQSVCLRSGWRRKYWHGGCCETSHALSWSQRCDSCSLQRMQWMRRREMAALGRTAQMIPKQPCAQVLK